MKYIPKQYAYSAGATFRGKGTHFKAYPYVIRSRGSRVASGSYPRPALPCAQLNSTTSFHRACYFDHAGIVYSGLLKPRMNGAFNSSFKNFPAISPPWWARL
ncbi:hypothetical protein M2262_002351 [Pseudomonas sp. BIGb0408]|uniref:Uncharacterized protein n=1 Tax=Phytopseudomonas flavescens TaxID=29435 RepID=A0A7Y9XN94_9GAMM|nr:hypothetical protein [Pseudomonas sp. BIGb0408]NYH73127.1 hypothetical protein [Pseudomonas flavescens]